MNANEVKELKEEIQEKLEKLERDKYSYLEVNKSAYARKIEKKIYKLEFLLDLIKIYDQKKELKAREFIKYKGMIREFENYLEK